MNKIINNTRKQVKLTKLTVEDAAFMLELLNTPKFKRFVGDRGLNTVKDAEKYLLEGPLKLYDTHGFGMLKISLVDLDTPIGACGLLVKDYLDKPDLGIALLPEYEARGYMDEALRTYIDLLKSQTSVESFYGVIDPANYASLRLIKKFKMRFLKNIEQGGKQLSVYEYLLK